ncbi:MAG: hypothetical protein WC492_03950 [Candidatus Micrarchaeia archaeon]
MNAKQNGQFNVLNNGIFANQKLTINQKFELTAVIGGFRGQYSDEKVPNEQIKHICNVVKRMTKKFESGKGKQKLM